MGLSNAKPHSISSNKLTLAEKRYRVNGSNGINLRRKSTRKQEISLENMAKQTENGETIELAEVLPGSDEIDPRLMALYPQHAQQRSASSVSATNLANQNAANAILLTRTQRVLIENSWRRSRKTGADSVEKIPQGRLKYDPRFRKHAALLTKTFDYIVKNLAYTEKLCQHFQALGKKHCQLQGRAFQQIYWDAFSECITQSAIEESGYRCRETTIAWRSLVAFIIKQMRRGFDEEKALRKRFSASLMGIASRGSTASIQTKSGSSNPLVSSFASYRNLGDYRISSLSSLHANSAGYNRQRTSSMNSTVSAATVCVAGATSLTPNVSASKESARSASWCSEQQEFEAQFTRMATSPNLSFTFGGAENVQKEGLVPSRSITPLPPQPASSLAAKYIFGLLPSSPNLKHSCES
uniref:Globin family profile domain-containing protein n=1 Tax=Ditylenchus dipsaci TaxID=166011 RepID=A0A915EPS0_9BILA